MLRFHNLARYSDIGTNSYLLELGETQIVLDAGTHPKHPGKKTLPQFELIEPDALDAIIVSHPHLDHIGALPCLGREQPRATVVMSEGTKQAGRALLHNSVNVMKALRTEINEPDYPLYNHRHIDQQYRDWVTRGLRSPFNLGDIDRVECEFYHAGHVMGAVGVSFKHENHTVFYTGDVHFEDQTLVKKAEFPTEGIDTLILESTRGAAERDPAYSRKAEQARLGEVIQETINRGGAVLVPVFAFGKTQEVVLMLKELMDAETLDSVTVHIGGLSSKMTAISDDHSDCAERFHQKFKIMNEFPNLEVMKRGKGLPDFHQGHIYALSSGMMTEKTVSNKFAKQILRDERNTLIFVGYADPDSPGGKIKQAAPGDTVLLDEATEKYCPVNCQVEEFDFSGHATRDQLVDYAVAVNPKKVLLVHGDMPAKQWLQEQLKTRLPETEVLIPEAGEAIDLV